jgi:adenylate kinase family enzyme
MERINVVGTSCSGKTTLARALARRLALPCIELDALFWGPGWTPVPEEVFRQRVATAVAGERWIVDGGYRPVRHLTWARVDTVVWLDYPMRTVLAQWASRTVARIRSREEFWPGTGNRESAWNALKPDGLLWWILRTHRQRRRSLAAQLAERPDVRVIRLRSPADAARWLASDAAAG